MVVLLPVVLLLIVLGLGSGQSNLLLLVPMLVVLGAGAVVITIALRDGRTTPDRSVRRLPTDHLRRHMYLALRPPRPRRNPGRDTKPK